MGAYRFGAIMLLGWLLISTSFPLLAGNSPGLLITEVYYNSPGQDHEEEWIELTNFGSQLVDLAAYKIGDEETRGGGEGMLQFPEGAQIGPGQTIVVAQAAAAFQRRWGFLPDYEITDSDPAVPLMRVYSPWASGRVALANDGDELLLLDGQDQLVDALSYGGGATHFTGIAYGPPIPTAPQGWSLERNPAHCQSWSAGDWLPQRAPTPGQIPTPGECRAQFTEVTAVAPDQLPPIGQIQGSGDISPYVNQTVSFRGVVTGVQTYRNVRGLTYYTLFVQDAPGSEDGDPATSDGIAVFHGRPQPTVAIGDLIRINGRVIEFFGLTEISDDGLEIVIEARNQPLPDPIPLNPPADNEAAARYYEALEGMRVAVPGTAIVVGPTYASCGLAVVREDSGLSRVLRHRIEDPVGPIIQVLHPTNVRCDGFPLAATGDRVSGLIGPLTYQFDEFRLVQQNDRPLDHQPAARPALTPPPTAAPHQISVASYNLENYFDTIHDTGLDSEPVRTAAELAVQRAKLAYGLGPVLGCPTLVGVQEVEKAALLEELAAEAAVHCGFTYAVAHLESADLRGIDVALLYDPRRATLVDMRLHQICARLETGIRDRQLSCPAGEWPLSSRPPLQVDLLVDGRPLTLFVNHFKSKLGGELETTPQRMAQAQLLADLSRELLAADPTAAVIVLGDFNDYFLSPPMQIMAGPHGPLVNILAQVPEEERYSFIYNGASQLIDGLLLSPALVERTAQATILHVNADYPFSYRQDITPGGMPFRSADHDLPLLILNWNGVGEEMATAVEAGSRGWLIWLVVGAAGASAVGFVVWRRRR
jgi:uncharacterized protein